MLTQCRRCMRMSCSSSSCPVFSSQASSSSGPASHSVPWQPLHPCTCHHTSPAWDLYNINFVHAVNGKSCASTEQQPVCHYCHPQLNLGHPHLCSALHACCQLCCKIHPPCWLTRPLFFSSSAIASALVLRQKMSLPKLSLMQPRISSIPPRISATP